MLLIGIYLCMFQIHSLDCGFSQLRSLAQLNHPWSALADVMYPVMWLNVMNDYRRQGCQQMPRNNLDWYLTQLFCHLKQKQDRQSTCNIKMRRESELLLKWKSNKYYICVCTCVRVPERMGVCMRARACRLFLYIMLLICAMWWRHLWPLWLHHIFRLYLINGAISAKKKKKVTGHKICVLIFFTNFV
jgi:hypothetical protein